MRLVFEKIGRNNVGENDKIGRKIRLVFEKIGRNLRSKAAAEKGGVLPCFCPELFRCCFEGVRLLLRWGAQQLPGSSGKGVEKG